MLCEVLCALVVLLLIYLRFGIFFYKGEDVMLCIIDVPIASKGLNVPKRILQKTADENKASDAQAGKRRFRFVNHSMKACREQSWLRRLCLVVRGKESKSLDAVKIARKAPILFPTSRA